MVKFFKEMGMANLSTKKLGEVFKKIKTFLWILWIKISKLFKVYLILALLSVAVPLYFDLSNTYDSLNNKTYSILMGHSFNRGLLNTILKDFKENKSSIFSYKFSTEIYKENWDIISTLSGECPKNYFELVATLDSINSINTSILTLYNQEGLIFETNQWKNTKDRESQWVQDLKQKADKADNLFGQVSNCGFHYFTLYNEIIVFFRNLFSGFSL